MTDELKRRINELHGKLEALESEVKEVELNQALQYLPEDPSSSLTKCRIVLEKLVYTYFKKTTGKEPKRRELGIMLKNNQFTREFPRRIVVRMNSIRELANLGPHGTKVESSDAKKVLSELCDILEWHFDQELGSDYNVNVQSPNENDSEVAEARKAILLELLKDPKYKWRKFQTLMNAIDAEEQTTRNLLLSIGARCSTSGKPVWGLERNDVL